MFHCLHDQLIPEFVTADGFELVPGARFATKAEYAKAVPTGGMTMRILMLALAAAADDEGMLKDFDPPSFFEGHIMEAMGLAAEDLSTPITYDTFTSAFLIEAMMHLTISGYLAHRGNGDSVDYRLALPQ